MGDSRSSCASICQYMRCNWDRLWEQMFLTSKCPESRGCCFSIDRKLWWLEGLSSMSFKSLFPLHNHVSFQRPSFLCVSCRGPTSSLLFHASYHFYTTRSKQILLSNKTFPNLPSCSKSSLQRKNYLWPIDTFLCRGIDQQRIALHIFKEN